MNEGVLIYIIFFLIIVIVGLLFLCITWKEVSNRLEKQRDRVWELYLQEYRKNMQKLKKDILRDDLSVLINNEGHDK